MLIRLAYFIVFSFNSVKRTNEEAQIVIKVKMARFYQPRSNIVFHQWILHLVGKGLSAIVHLDSLERKRGVTIHTARQGSYGSSIYCAFRLFPILAIRVSRPFRPNNGFNLEKIICQAKIINC